MTADALCNRRGHAWTSVQIVDDDWTTDTHLECQRCSRCRKTRGVMLFYE